MKAQPLICLFCVVCGHAQTVLVRDIDKRPLAAVKLQQLSPAAQHAVQAILDDQKSLFVEDNRKRATPVLPEFTLQRIPVAPAGHHLYELTLTGEFGCTGNGPNCRTAVLDETSAGVDVVQDGDYSAVDVIRRPNLQMPDLACYEQEGHVGTSTAVYRFDGSAWKPFRCVYANFPDFPPRRVVADQPCKP